MQRIEHYIRLRERLQQTSEVTIQELSEILCCTPRNVKIIMKKMAQEGWIDWHPGNGRGHRSHLTFRVQGEDMVLQHAQEMVKKGDATAALELIGTHKAVREPFWQWLWGQFGYRSQVEQGAQRDTLSFPYFRPLLTLDPAQVNRQTELHMVQQIYDTLLKFDERDGGVMPHIAHAWKSDDAAQEWTFFLRKGVLFHHGCELTAYDVRHTVERLQRSSYRWMFADVREIDVLSPYLIRIHLTDSNRLFPHFLASARASIVPADADADVPVGTGPFQVVRNDERQVVLHAFPSYFQGRAHLDAVEIWIVPDLREHQGLEQSTSYLPFLPDALEGPGDWEEIERRDLACRYISFNLRKPGPQQDLRFRRAIACLLDKQSLVTTLRGNRVHTADRLSLEGEIRSQYDPQQARWLLEEVEGRTLHLFTYDHVHNVEDASWITEQCAKAGVRVEVSILPFPELLERAGEADAILSGTVREADSAFSRLEPFLTENSIIRRHLDESLAVRVDEIFTAWKKEPVPSLLSQIEDELLERQAYLPLYSTGQSTFYHPSLQGVKLSAFGFISFRDLWFFRET